MLFIYYSFWRSVHTHFKTQWLDSVWNYLAVFSWYSFLWKQQNSKIHHTECLWVITSKNPKTPGIKKRSSTKEHWYRRLIWTKLCQVFLLCFFKWRNKLGNEAEGKKDKKKTKTNSYYRVTVVLYLTEVCDVRELQTSLAHLSWRSMTCLARSIPF